MPYCIHHYLRQKNFYLLEGIMKGSEDFALKLDLKKLLFQLMQDAFVCWAKVNYLEEYSRFQHNH